MKAIVTFVVIFCYVSIPYKEYRMKFCEPSLYLFWVTKKYSFEVRLKTRANISLKKLIRNRL
jgi:hypothetical protein